MKKIKFNLIFFIDLSQKNHIQMTRKKIINVIFDADGVLLVSTEAGINTLLKAISICELKGPNFDQLRLIWGCRLETELIPLLSKKYSWPIGSEKQVIDLFLDLSNDVNYPSQPKLAKLLESLVDNGYQLGVATNRDAKGLIWRFSQHGIKTNLFKHVQTPEGGFSKPDPRVFHHFWYALNFNPGETLYVGDSIAHDLEVTRRSSPLLSFAGITSGLHTREEFIGVGVPKTHIFDNVVNLITMLPSL